MTKRERKRRRKRRFPANLCLGHTVKSCMTVIVSMGSYQIMHEVYAESVRRPSNEVAFFMQADVADI